MERRDIARRAFKSAALMSGKMRQQFRMASSPEEIAREQADGPFDFSWLLRRIADFGGKDSFRSASGQPAQDQANGVDAPPPLQLLVPETVEFRKDSANGSNLPVSLYFTDRKGYLRGLRQTAQEQPKIFQAMHRLAVHRGQPLALTHSARVWV